jgi:hypothetical protein
MTATSHRPIAAATISSRVTRTPTAVETATIPPSLISAFNSSTDISNNSATVFSGKCGRGERKMWRMRVRVLASMIHLLGLI